RQALRINRHGISYVLFMLTSVIIDSYETDYNHKNFLIMQYLYQKVNFLPFKKQSSLIFILNRDRMTFTVTSEQ
ncbi:MAG: hypothetical protein ABRQ38_19935, partial [Candidatus Eremiobacterota bacterium]